MRFRWWPPARTDDRTNRTEAEGLQAERADAEDGKAEAVDDRPSADGKPAVDGKPGHRGGARRRRTGPRRFFTWRKLLGAFLALCLLLSGAFAVLYFSIDIPEANKQAKAQSNVYLYSDGTVAARTGEVNRESVPIGRVPKAVQHAFVAAENKSFYDDAGVDPVGIARGLINTVSGKGTQGGSTITQQYVKNYYLSQEQTVTRKVKEMVISLKVDQRNSKDDILAGYLNTSYFGRVAYGIQAAARAYYDTNVDDLTVAQGAYLAALLQAPSQYDWAVAGPSTRKLVKERWNYVLNNMVEKGWLDKAERQGLTFPEPVAPKPATGLGGQAGYFVDAARQELIDSGVSEQELAAGGWTITLNIDRHRQKALEHAVAQNLDGTGKSAKSREAQPDTQAGAVSVDPRDGRIVALYGGRDYTEHYLDNATRSDYQAGPAFRPILLAAGMEQKPYRVLPEAKDSRQDAKAALTKAEQTGQVKDVAVDLGMDPRTGGFGAHRAMELGLVGISPMELAGVYATFDNHGRKVTPSIVKSANRGGEHARLHEAVGDRVVQERTADEVTAGFLGAREMGGSDEPMMVSTAKQSVAGVSGPTDDRKAAWCVGYTPELVTAVGVFGEHHKTHKQTALEHPHDGRAERIWSTYTDQALRGAPPAAFSLSPGGAR